MHYSVFDLGTVACNDIWRHIFLLNVMNVQRRAERQYLLCYSMFVNVIQMPRESCKTIEVLGQYWTLPDGCTERERRIYSGLVSLHLKKAKKKKNYA